MWTLCGLATVVSAHCWAPLCVIWWMSDEPNTPSFYSQTTRSDQRD